MTFEAGSIFVSLPTVGAFVGSYVAVRRNVSVQVGRMTKRLVTVRALIGGGRAVSCLVFLQMCLLPKSFLTNNTLEGPLS